MVVLDDDDSHHKSEHDNGNYLRHTSMPNLELEQIPDRSTVGRFADTWIWVLVFLGILLCFPIGFVGLYFIYTARIEYHAEHRASAMRRAFMAKMTALAAVVAGMLWIGLLIGLTVWS